MRGWHTAKLSPGEAEAIRVYAARGAKASELAFEYDVSEKQIQRIVRGERWAGNYGLTERQALDIYIRVHAGEKQSSLAAEYGISQPMVSGIKNGRSHTRTTGHTPYRKASQ